MKIGWCVMCLVAACGETNIPPRPDAGSPTSPEDLTPCVSVAKPARGRPGSQLTLFGDFGDAPVKVLLSSGSAEHEATVVSWSPTQVVVTVPQSDPGDFSVKLSAGCVSQTPPHFVVAPPPRVYIHNNANGADGFDSITTLAYDPDSGALSPLGPPTSMGLAASGRPGCSDSLMLYGGQLYASGDTGVAIFDVDYRTGALKAIDGSPFASGATGGAGLGSGTYIWQATDGGIVAWTHDSVVGLDHRVSVTTTPAASMLLNGTIRPSGIFATRGDGRLDAWAITYVPQAGQLPMPVAAPLAGSPYAASATGAGVDIGAFGVQYSVENVYVGTPAGLGVWQRDPHTGGLAEVSGSPFPLAAPSGVLSGSHLNLGSTKELYMVSTGSGYLVGATLDTSGLPTAMPGSPWNYSPDLTNLSCFTSASGATEDAVRLIALDAGNGRVGVFDPPADGGRPVPVAGSPFALTQTPSELASGIAVLE